MTKHFYQSDIMFYKTQSLLSRNISEFNLSTLEIDSKISSEQVIPGYSYTKTNRCVYGDLEE